MAFAMEQTIQQDGRVELLPEVDAGLGTSGLHNDDLAPVPIEKRTWTTYNYLALWIGMAINIPTWLLASGLIALGMAWYQALFTIFLANVLVLIPMLADQPRGHQVRDPVPGHRAGVVRHLRRQPAGADARLRRLRLVRHPDLDRRHGPVRRRRRAALTLTGDASGWTTADRISLGIGDAACPAVDAVAVLRDLLGAQHRDHPVGHGGDQEVRELGGPVPDRRLPGPHGLDGRPGRRPRPGRRASRASWAGARTSGRSSRSR